ncbi:hypothetical protein HW132_11875 [Brasilonema sp. CT11]|nr:hypothetical protein [Brasilonema sp. CT11]
MRAKSNSHQLSVISYQLPVLKEKYGFVSFVNPMANATPYGYRGEPPVPLR